MGLVLLGLVWWLGDVGVIVGGWEGVRAVCVVGREAEMSVCGD